MAEALTAATGRAAQLVALSTTGDDDPARAVTSFDAKGLFVDGVRAAVLEGRCEVAVHSYKDLPTEPAAGLVVAAVPARADPRDALVTRGGLELAALPAGSTVGTSSARRRAQLAHARPDLVVRALRGNLDTRLARVADGDLDAVVVALAGLVRLGPTGLAVTAVPLGHDRCLHAPAQGALAVECRADDGGTRAELRAVDDPASRRAAHAERRLLACLEGGCTAPIGAHAEPLDGDGSRLELTGVLADPDGAAVLRATAQGRAGALDDLAGAVAAELRTRGEHIVRRLRSDRRERVFGGP